MGKADVWPVFCCGACGQAEPGAGGEIRYTPSPALVIRPGGEGATLVIQRGSNQRRVAIAGIGRLVIGRDPSADIQIDDRAMSRRACELEITEAGEVFVSDHQSAHGTDVNGTRITRWRLHQQDTIRVASTLLRFHAG